MLLQLNQPIQDNQFHIIITFFNNQIYVTLGSSLKLKGSKPFFLVMKRINWKISEIEEKTQAATQSWHRNYPDKQILKFFVHFFSMLQKSHLKAHNGIGL